MRHSVVQPTKQAFWKIRGVQSCPLLLGAFSVPPKGFKSNFWCWSGMKCCYIDFLDSAVFPFGRKQKQHSVTEKMMLTSSLKKSSKNIRSAESYTVCNVNVLVNWSKNLTQTEMSEFGTKQGNNQVTSARKDKVFTRWNLDCMKLIKIAISWSAVIDAAFCSGFWAAVNLAFLPLCWRHRDPQSIIHGSPAKLRLS